MSKHKRAQNKRKRRQLYTPSLCWGEKFLTEDEKQIVFTRTTNFIISQLSSDLMSVRSTNTVEFLRTRLEDFKRIFPKISYSSISKVRRFNTRQEFYKINIFMYDGEITGSFILRSEHVEA